MDRAWKHFERDFFTGLFNQYNSFSVGLLVIITETDKEGLFVPINSIEEILEDFRHGRMVLIMDDEDRENEGDLIIAADCVSANDVTFFARNACGLICLTLTEEKASQLQLPLMVEKNGSSHSTNFTVSIEAAEGITTGISAADRAQTIKAAVNKNAQPSDLVQPGHIFPLISQPGGVLTRAGHTEAGTDLARLSGHEPASVIVEVMNEDGTMAKRPELEAFAEKHGIKIGTIADLIQYRSLHDTTIEKMDQRSVDTAYGNFVLKTYRDNISDCVHYALVRGEVEQDRPCPVRVHLLNTLRDIFQTVRPEFSDSWSLSESMKFVDEADNGVIVLIGQEFNQLEELKKVSLFPETTTAATKSSDTGSYRVVGTGSQILRDVGVGKMRLLSSPTRFNAISGFNLEVIEFIEKN